MPYKIVLINVCFFCRILLQTYAYLCPLRVELFGLFGIFQTLVKLPQFAVCCWPVCKQNMVGRIELDSFCVQLDSSPEISTVHSFRAFSDLLQIQGLVGATWPTRRLAVWGRWRGLSCAYCGMISVICGVAIGLVRDWRWWCSWRGWFSRPRWWWSPYGMWAMERLWWRALSLCVITRL